MSPSLVSIALLIIKFLISEKESLLILSLFFFNSGAPVILELAYRLKIYSNFK